LYAFRILLMPEPNCSTMPTSLNTRINSLLRGAELRGYNHYEPQHCCKASISSTPNEFTLVFDAI
jgi:hypothetical protein